MCCQKSRRYRTCPRRHELSETPAVGSSGRRGAARVRGRLRGTTQRGRSTMRPAKECHFEKHLASEGSRLTRQTNRSAARWSSLWALSDETASEDMEGDRSPRRFANAQAPCCVNNEGPLRTVRVPACQPNPPDLTTTKRMAARPSSYLQRSPLHPSYPEL